MNNELTDHKQICDALLGRTITGVWTLRDGDSLDTLTLQLDSEATYELYGIWTRQQHHPPKTSPRHPHNATLRRRANPQMNTPLWLARHNETTPPATDDPPPDETEAPAE